ncbi:MAG: hypothetical protein KIS92_10715 [Planctomycetota bacterium]|nr:hypothetical protein [Planctomycetota bacterium]
MARARGWWCLVLLAAAAAQGADGWPWRSDVADARAEALKAGRPLVLLANADSSALCRLIVNVETHLKETGGLAPLAGRAVLAAARMKDAAGPRLCAEFEIPCLSAWIVALDAKGETLASFLVDSTSLGCTEESKRQFTARLAAAIGKALDLTESVQELERRWRAHPDDAAALEALAERSWAMFRPKSFAEFCEKEAANAACAQATRDTLRIYAYLSKAHGWYAFGSLGNAGRKTLLREEGARLLRAFPGHPSAAAVEAAWFNTWANGMTFDVPGKARALAAALLEDTREAGEAQAQALRARIASLEKRAAEWVRATEAQFKAEPSNTMLAAQLGDAEATLKAYGGTEALRAYYKDLVDAAEAKLAGDRKK